MSNLIDAETWRKSSFSGGSSGNCVEVGTGPDAFGVRDSKDRAGGVLVFEAASWSAFTAGVKANRFAR